MRVAYIRVSTIDQNEARQVEALEKYDIERYFTEKASAKDTNRPVLQEMMDFVREGDSVYVHDFSRLARSTADLLNIAERLKEKKVELVSIKENIDTSTPTGKLMLTMIAAIAEFERENLLERQREGIAIAKREGKYKGGKPKTVHLEAYARELAKYRSRQQTKKEMAENLGVSRPTLDKMFKQYRIDVSENEEVDTMQLQEELKRAGYPEG